MRSSILAAAAFGILSASVLAQPGVVPPGSVPPRPAPTVIQQPAPVAPVRPTYDSLVKRDAAGKIIRIPGCLDALALMRNTLIDDAARAAMDPLVTDWTAEVNQVAIDNLDFIEKIEGGIIDTYDVNDANRTQLIQKMNVQLSAAGPLSARLAQKNTISGQAAGLNMQITNEYIQSVFNEINSMPAPAASPAAPAAADNQKQQFANAGAVNRFFTALSSRDSCEQYRRMLLDSAGLIDKILPDLPEAARAKAAGRVPAVKSAPDEVAKMMAVRDLLGELSFDDRRAFLNKAVALGAAADPFHPAPELPRADLRE